MSRTDQAHSIADQRRDPKPFFDLRAGVIWFCLTLISAACNRTAEPPVTLAARVSTSMPTITPRIQPSATSPVGFSSVRPVDPSVSAILEEVSSARLVESVNILAALGTRHVLSVQDDPNRGIGAARNWIQAQFESIRESHPEKQIEVWLQPFSYQWRIWEIAAQNVILRLPGSDPNAGIYIIGAHYDSIGSDPFNANLPAPGANDNGSGVAGMLEIARIMAGRTPRHTLLFVAFSAEETGRQGSLAFVNDYLRAQRPPLDLKGMINLDMIGGEQGERGTREPRLMRLFSGEPNTSPSRQFARQLWLVVNSYIGDMNVVMQPTEDREGRWGDQQSFTAVGYGAVRLIQGVENPNLQHNQWDTLEAVQEDYLRRATRTVLAGLLVLTESLPAPSGFSLRRDSAGTVSLNWVVVDGAGGYLVLLRTENSILYDQVLTLNGGSVNRLEWDRFDQFQYISMMSVDSAGRAGAASPEIMISRLLSP